MLHIALHFRDNYDNSHLLPYVSLLIFLDLLGVLVFLGDFCVFCLFFFMYFSWKDTMVTEGQPTDLVKVLHLLVMSFSWGMQVWVSFIAGMKHKNSHESCIPVSAPY